jgi:DNA-binding MarR family transcriptional regulator
MRRAVETASKDKLRVWLRMLRTTRLIEAELREYLRLEFDSTLPRFDVMAALARAQSGLTMTHLSRDLLVSNGNVTGIVERLVAEKLVLRVGDAADKRTTRVQLTAKGKRDFALMASAHETWVNGSLEHLSTPDVGALLGLLNKAAARHAAGHEDAPAKFGANHGR